MAPKLEQIEKSKFEFDEYDIIQNSVLGAHCIYEAVRKAEDFKETGLLMPITYLILPIVYNNNFSDRIYNKNFKLSSFYKSIYESQFNYLNVIEHADILFKTTSRAILIARDTSLLVYDTENSTLRTNSNKQVTLSNFVSGSDYKRVLASSKRIGSWFGQLRNEEILNIFNQ